MRKAVLKGTEQSDARKVALPGGESAGVGMALVRNESFLANGGCEKRDQKFPCH